jgi:hypothetical protein
VLGSFYTVGDVSHKDLSGNKLNIVYCNDISGNVQYIYNNDISGNKLKVTYNKDLAYTNSKLVRDISGNAAF